MPEARYDFVPSSGDSHCETGGPSKAAGEATLIRYLRLRMNGIVPPATKQYPLAVR